MTCSSLFLVSSVSSVEVIAVGALRSFRCDMLCDTVNNGHKIIPPFLTLIVLLYMQVKTVKSTPIVNQPVGNYFCSISVYLGYKPNRACQRVSHNASFWISQANDSIYEFSLVSLGIPVPNCVVGLLLTHLLVNKTWGILDKWPICNGAPFNRS